MRLGWIVLILGLGSMAMGGAALYEAHAAGAEKTIAYTDLVKAMPSHGWYRVTGARWSPIDAVTLQGLLRTTSEDVYVRVHADGTSSADDAPAKLLVHVRDQALADYVVDILTRSAEQPRLASESQKLQEEHPIEGTLEDVLTIDHTDQKGVRGALGERLADDYLVITQGNRPNGARRGAVLLAVGLALLALSALLLLRRGPGPVDEPAGQQG